MSEDTIARGLQQEYAWLSDEEANSIAHMANGSYLTALKTMRETSDNQNYFEDFVSLMRNAWLVGQKKDYSALLKLRQWSNDMADSKVGREKQKAFLQYVQKQIRENFIFNFGAMEMNYQTVEERNFSSKFARFIHGGNVERIMEELGKAEMQITQNGNAKIIFFDLCLQMIVLIR
jgi:DNA polymerase-3 subunit delta'